MKTEKWVLLCMILFLVQLVACERSEMEQPGPENVSLRTNGDSTGQEANNRYITTATTTGIRQRDSISFTLINGASSNVMWRVTPAEIVVNNGRSAFIYFSQAGPHTVYAIDSLSLDTTRLDVDVAVANNTNPPFYEQPFFEDDVLSITPVVSSDSAEVLELRIMTNKNYDCLNNNLLLYRQAGGGNYQISFTKVLTGTSCEPGERQARGSVWFVVGDQGNIKINFNNKVYNGSFVRNGRNFTFDWPYESGVVFTRKNL